MCFNLPLTPLSSLYLTFLLLVTSICWPVFSVAATHLYPRAAFHFSFSTILLQQPGHTSSAFAHESPPLLLFFVVFFSSSFRPPPHPFYSHFVPPFLSWKTLYSQLAALRPLSVCMNIDYWLLMSWYHDLRESSWLLFFSLSFTTPPFTYAYVSHIDSALFWMERVSQKIVCN